MLPDVVITIMNNKLLVVIRVKKPDLTDICIHNTKVNSVED